MFLLHAQRLQRLIIAEEMYSTGQQHWYKKAFLTHGYPRVNEGTG